MKPWNLVYRNEARNFSFEMLVDISMLKLKNWAERQEKDLCISVVVRAKRNEHLFVSSKILIFFQFLLISSLLEEYSNISQKEVSKL